jgi:hypothetical protein
MTLTAVPIELKHANAVVGKHHRHNLPVTGAKFCIGVCDETGKLWGVAIVGRPIARLLDDGYTAEVLRVCVLPDAPKGCNSFLYARCWRAWEAMGGRRIITYTLQSESGASLRGAGWERADASKPSPWSNKSRPRQHQDIYTKEKYVWSKGKTVNLPHPKTMRMVEENEPQMALWGEP